MTTELLPFPRVLRIEPASQCNLSCSHCPTGTVDMPRQIMGEEIFEKILIEIEEHRESIKVIVLYHGGEPLLNKNFYQMVRSIRSVSPSVFIKTVSNGMGLNENNAIELVNCGIDSVEFSLDGDSAAESNAVRVNSDAERILRNIKNFLVHNRESARPIDVFIATTQFVRKPELDTPVSKPDVPDWLLEAFNDEDVKFKTTYSVKWPHMGDSGDYDYFKSPFDTDDQNECDHVLNTITVRSDGAIVPCCYDLTSKLTMGSVQEDRLIDIWQGEKYAELRQSINLGKFISICRTCAVVRPPIYLMPKWKIPVEQIG